ncbi:MAG: nuclear transport factor 2 family protein [Pseudomonadota bacterium]
MSEIEVKALTEQWLAGWNIGEATFDGGRFRQIFAPGGGGISVFDNVEGDVIELSSVDDYVATWTPFMAPMTNWSTKLEAHKVQVVGDMALSTFRLVGTDTRGPNGEQIPFGQYGSHVWRRLPGLGWRIVHEHLTAYDVAKEQS